MGPLAKLLRKIKKIGFMEIEDLQSNPDNLQRIEVEKDGTNSTSKAVLIDRERIEELKESGDFEVARKSVLEVVLGNPDSIEAVVLLSELSEGLHRQEILIDALRISPQEKWLIENIARKEIEFFFRRETPGIDALTNRLRRVLFAALEYNVLNVKDVLLEVTKDSYKINPVLTKEICISIFRVLAEFSERCGIEYYWSLGQNLIDNRIKRAVFFSCKREGFLFEALRLSNSIDSEEDRDFEKWKILEQIEAIILEGDETQIIKSLKNRNFPEKVGKNHLWESLTWIGKDSSLIRQFLRESDPDKSIEFTVKKLRALMLENKKEVLFNSEMVEFGEFSSDLAELPLHTLESRISAQINEFGDDSVIEEISNTILSNDLGISRRIQIILAASRVLMISKPQSALEIMHDYLAENKSDERIIRVASQCYERMGNYTEAIGALQGSLQPSSLTLLRQIEKRRDWLENGYDLDFLGDLSEYSKPKIGTVLYNVHSSLPYITSGYTIRSKGIIDSMSESGMNIIVNSRWGFPVDRSDYVGEEVIPESMEIDGVNHIFSPDSSGMYDNKMEDYVQLAAKSILSKAIEHRPSIIHACSDHTIGLASAIVAKSLSVPFIYEMRGVWAFSRAANNPGFASDPRFALMIRLEKQCAMAADHLFVISESLKEEVKSWGVDSSKISVLPNGITHLPLGNYETGGRDEISKDQQTLVLGYIGSIVPYEGLDDLAKSISVLSKKERMGVKCLIAGGGSSEEELREQVSDLGIDDNFHFMGRIPREEIGEFYKNIDAVVLPRKSYKVCELIPPIKPIEAMAYSKPVIMSNVTVATEIVRESNSGILFEKDNPEHLAEKIKGIVSGSEKITGYGERGRKWVSENRLWSLLTKPLIRKYADFEILSSGNGTYAEIELTMSLADHYSRCLNIRKKDLISSVLRSLTDSEHRSGRNIFTAGLRGLSKENNSEAIELFDEFFTLFGDYRSLRTGVTIHNREKKFDRSLRLVSEMEEGGWKEEMISFLEDKIGIGEQQEHGKRISNMVKHLENKVVSKSVRRLFSGKSMESANVACILDEFSYSSFRHTCNMIQLSATNWREEMEENSPEILFVESAWDGKNSEWKGKISHRGSELVELLYWCKMNGVVTIFWNKEDPVHFNTFINSAKLFDNVFTTDIDCVQKYRKSLGNDSAYFLPFACEPAIHNPIEEIERERGICFAGAYYERYTRRCQDMHSVISEYAKGPIPVTIYDRNFQTEDSRYMFPDKFQELIRGKLPYDEIDKAYKGFDYALNFNSVKDSQTMMARRVFELAASNTMIISNYSRSLKILFGDLLIASDDGVNSRRELDEYVREDHRCKKRRLLALRKVMTEHTYHDRMSRIFKIIGKGYQWKRPKVTIIAECSSEKELQSVFESVERQQVLEKRLIIISDDISVLPVKDTVEASLVSTREAAKSPLLDNLRDSSLVAVFKPLNFYGENYLTDITLATRYCDSNAITKASYWKITDGGEMEYFGNGEEYKIVEKWTSGSCVIKTQSLAGLDLSIESFIRSVEDNSLGISSIISIDGFNYFENWFSPKNNFSEEELGRVLDLKNVDQGYNISEIDKMGEKEVVSGPDKPVRGIGLPEIFSEFNRENLSLTYDENYIFIESSMRDGEHHYHYSKQKITPPELGFVDGKGKFYFDCESGLSLSLAFIFFDGNGERVGSQIIPSRTNSEVDIAEGTQSILLGIRSYSSGRSLIRSIDIGFRDIGGVSFVESRNKQLVLTNNYPEYDDLYKNAFIHSRIVRYNSFEVGVDVFRHRLNAPLSFHEFEGQEVITGSSTALERLISDNRYDSILVHFLNKEMWEVLSKFEDDTEIYVWVHGSEIQPWHRREFNYQTDQERERAILASQEREAFWKGLLWDQPQNLHLIFVSRYFSEEVMEDYGVSLREDGYSIIHNPIDTDRFVFKERKRSDRFKVLSIRTFASEKYANDISANTILELSGRDCFKKLEFTIIGDGALYEEVTGPLERFENVTLIRGFLTNEEYEKVFQEFGIFLTPTRWDSHGVGRDEAMSCGLVPATNRISAIPEFVNRGCSILAEPEDHIGLADGIEELVNDPELFIKKSNKAAKRVRRQTSHDVTIPKEIELFIRED
tara:strand:- start:1520 stop:7855 length:6336 start_codon:yes stop_codon:yes gene_type:complete